MLFCFDFDPKISAKSTYSVDVLLITFYLFPIGLVKIESDFIVRSFDTGLRRLTLAVAVISVDACSFFDFSDLTFHLEDTEIGVF